MNFVWVDLDVYVRGAQAILHHENLYQVQARDLPFTYSPFAAEAFVPLLALGTIPARWMMTGLSVASYITVVIIFARRLNLGATMAVTIGLAGTTLECFIYTLRLGQVNLILMMLVVVDLFVVPARHRGVLIGLAAGIKIVPGAFAVYLLLRREWLAAGRSAAVFVGTIAISALAAPVDTIRFWSGGFISLGKWGASNVLAADNQSLIGLAMRLLHDATPPAPLLIGLSLGIFGVAGTLSRRLIARGDDPGAFMCVAVGALLASPISWTHHWVWVVPAIMLLVARRCLVSAWLAGGIFLTGPMWLLPIRHYRELSYSWYQMLAANSYVLPGLAFLTLVGLASWFIPTQHVVAAETLSEEICDPVLSESDFGVGARS